MSNNEKIDMKDLQKKWNKLKEKINVNPKEINKKKD